MLWKEVQLQLSDIIYTFSTLEYFLKRTQTVDHTSILRKKRGKKNKIVTAKGQSSDKELNRDNSKLKTKQGDQK